MIQFDKHFFQMGGSTTSTTKNAKKDKRTCYYFMFDFGNRMFFLYLNMFNDPEGMNVFVCRNILLGLLFLKVGHKVTWIWFSRLVSFLPW